MSKQAFASAIISKLKASIGTDGQSYNSGSASTAMAAVAAGITEYLVANTTVTIAYTGMIPGTPPTPDPVVSDTFQIVGSCVPPSPSNSFDSWLLEIQSNIISGFQLAPSGIAGTIFVQKPFLAPGIALTLADMTAFHDVSDESPQNGAWELVCDGIINWINSSAMNPAPGAATRPSSAGTANITNITLV